MDRFKRNSTKLIDAITRIIKKTEDEEEYKVLYMAWLENLEKDQVNNNLNSLTDLIETVLQGDEMKVVGMEWLFEKSSCKAGRTNKSKRCIQFFRDIPEASEQDLLKTKEEDDPLLVVFRRRNVFYSSYITGDNSIIYTETDNLAHSLVLYAGVYKVFGGDIPKAFVPFVSILNYFIFNEPWNSKYGKQTANFLNLKELLEKEIKRGFISCGIGKQK